MRARCANCRYVFTVESQGVQTCPNCGAELDIAFPREDLSGDRMPLPSTTGHDETSLDLPEGSQGEQSDRSIESFRGYSSFEEGPRFTSGFEGSSDDRSSIPPPSNEPEKRPTPWERRSELGFFKGLFDTLTLSLKQPIEFFSSMPTSDAKGAISYYWIIAGISTLVAGLWGTAFRLFSGSNDAQRAQLEEMLESLETMDDSIRPFFESLIPLLGFSTNASSIFYLQLLGILFIPLSLLVYVAVFHLAALMVGAGKNGFNATLRACAYSSAPLLLGLIPGCGSAIGGLAWMGFTVIGLARLQGVSYGKAVLVILMPAFLCCFCGCLASFGGVAGLAGIFGEGMSAGE